MQRVQLDESLMGRRVKYNGIVTSFNSQYVFDKMQTNRGSMDPEEFGRVFIKSYGPHRRDRIFQY